jgi:hypothetical protein
MKKRLNGRDEDEVRCENELRGLIYCHDIVV